MRPYYDMMDLRTHTSVVMRPYHDMMDLRTAMQRLLSGIGGVGSVEDEGPGGSVEEGWVGEQAEGPAVLVAGAVLGDGAAMVACGIAFVDFPAIHGVTLGEPGHIVVAVCLCQY